MLYPDFNDLISYKEQTFDKTQLARYKVHSTAVGGYQSLFRGQGLDFDAVREYVPGDDIRNIDWRVTARTGSPHLKLFKEERERNTVICVDVNSSMRFGTRNTFKSIQAARCTSLLGWRALRHQDRISSCFFGDVPGGLHYFASNRTRQTLLQMLKMLVDPPKEYHQVSLEKTLEHVSRVCHPGSLIYVISDFIDFSSVLFKESFLSHLSKTCEIVFISINDVADQTLIPAGIIGFCGQNKEKVYLNTDSLNVRKLYAEQWKENRSLLQSLVKRFKISLIELSTESDVRRDLLLELKNIRKGKKCLL